MPRRKKYKEPKYCPLQVLEENGVFKALEDQEDLFEGIRAPSPPEHWSGKEWAIKYKGYFYSRLLVRWAKDNATNGFYRIHDNYMIVFGSEEDAMLCYLAFS